MMKAISLGSWEWSWQELCDLRRQTKNTNRHTHTTLHHTTPTDLADFHNSSVRRET